MAVDLTLDEFKDKLRGTEVECKLCPTRSHSLIRHLRVKHHLSAGQYKKQYPEAKLASPLATELLRKMGRQAMTSADVESYMTQFGGTDAWDEKLAVIGAKFTNPPGSEARVPVKDPHFALMPDTALIAYAAEYGKNVYLEGPTGCGKTEWIIQTLARMGRPCMRVNMNGDVTAANFIGHVEADENGTKWVDGDLIVAAKGGFPVVIDEVDFCPPHIGAVLHPIMEGRKSIHVPYTGETVECQPGFMIFATANTGGAGDLLGRHAGVEVLNQAFLDRFDLKLTADYLPIEREWPMLQSRFPGMTKPDEVLKVLKAANDVRAAYKKNSLRVTWSTRKLITFCEIREAFGQKIAMEKVLLNWLDAEDRAAVTEVLKRLALPVA